MKIIIYLLMVLTFLSCEQWQIEKISPNLDSLCSISCYLSPDDSIHVVRIYALKNANESILLKDLDSLVIKNANVVISDGLESHTLNYSEQTKAFSGTFVVNPRTKYTLRVKALNNEFNASCIVPDEALITSDGIELSQLSDIGGHLKLSWKNRLNQSSAYNIHNIVQSNLVSTNILSFGQYELFEEPDKVTSIFKIEENFELSHFNLNNALISIDIIALSPELFHFSKEIQSNNSFIGISNYGFFDKFIPLNSLYSNIENGYGVFGAYNSLKVEKTIRL